MSEELRVLPVPAGLAGERADAGLAKLLGISRSQAAQLLVDGGAQQNHSPLGKSDLLQADAILEVSIPEPRAPLALEETAVAELRVVYQDEDLVVVDKPAGVAAHPSQGWDGPTVGGALLAMGISLTTSGAAERQGIVQRLDVGTSGLMMLAKRELAYARLKQMFRDRVVDKTYHAVVQGLPDPVSGTIDAPIIRHPRAEFKFMVGEGGKASITHYELLEAFPAASLLEIDLETGRTHQIRVHFSAFRHPLVGDDMYGADPKLAARLGLKRQWLHAVRLEFEHPISGERLSFESGYPEDLRHALAVLRGVDD